MPVNAWVSRQTRERKPTNSIEGTLQIIWGNGLCRNKTEKLNVLQLLSNYVECNAINHINNDLLFLDLIYSTNISSTQC